MSLTVAGAQTTVSPTDHQGYAANAGWLDFRPAGTGGLLITESCLSGDVYAANFGWISFGDGSPDNGYTYQNQSAGDCGVDLGDEGHLSGYAWCGNIG